MAAQGATATDHHVYETPERNDPEKEAIASEGAQDAETTSNKAPVISEQGSLKKEVVEESEKPDGRDASSNSSDDGLGGDQDLEKLGPVKSKEPEPPQGPNIVDWEGPDDPENPYNWSARKKWSNVAILSFLTLLTPLASSMFAPGVPDVIREFHTTNASLATFVVSVYILGFAMGPLVLAPLSEMYGRVPLYNICNICFVAFTVGCALAPSMNALIGFRFLAGCFGIAPITNGGGTIADLMVAEKRGRAMSIWAIGRKCSNCRSSIICFNDKP